MNRARVIEAADLSLLVARGLLRPGGDHRARMAARKHLGEAFRLYTQAGLSQRANMVARYAYRLLRRKRASDPTTLEDAMLEYLYGPGGRGGAR